MKQHIFLMSLILFYQVSFGQETGNFTDNRDGKTYKTVEIGGQSWIAENLAYLPKKYNDNDLSEKKTDQ